MALLQKSESPVHAGLGGLIGMVAGAEPGICKSRGYFVVLLANVPSTPCRVRIGLRIHHLITPLLDVPRIA